VLFKKKIVEVLNKVHAERRQSETDPDVPFNFIGEDNNNKGDGCSSCLSSCLII